MRLLNIYTLELKQFCGDDVPPYFILSHRWEGEEITYKDFLKGRRLGSRGRQKVEEFCAFARVQNEEEASGGTFGCAAVVEWVWVDTCCIDKTSSAELSEAINSMYAWYEAAAACFVYLNDVFVSDVDQDERYQFMESSWFLRGWTLQELLAPDAVIFCNADWEILGCKNIPDGERGDRFQSSYGPSLTTSIARATAIPADYLQGKNNDRIHNASVAERLSWAAQRQTTHIEDQAYCLLGILQVNMPLLYGERARAFLRLQQAIMQQSTDKSLFAWALAAGTGTSCEGILADSPRCFALADYGYVIPTYEDGSVTTLTSRGLHLRGRAVRISREEFNTRIRAVGGRSVVEAEGDVFFLTWYSRHSRPRLFLTVALAHRVNCNRDDQFARVCAEDIGDTFERLFGLRRREMGPERSFYVDL